MRRTVSAVQYLSLLVLALGLPALAAGCGKADVSAAEAATSKEDPAKRGEYLVNAMGCADCHTPMVADEHGVHPDAARRMAGHPRDLQMPAPPAVAQPWGMVASATNTAFAGPWGISYAINLTSHESGLGTWSEQAFISALRKGQHLGDGRMIMPPMPWQAYATLTDDDLRAIFAYLRSLPAIDNKAPEYTPPSQLPAPAQ